MGGGRAGSDHPTDEWERSERASFRLALAIALLPIPAALLISWALGNPPWRSRPDLEDRQIAPAEQPHH